MIKKPAKIHRIYDIIHILSKTTRVIKLDTLADQYEVSPRTIRRDVQSIIDNFGAPFEIKNCCIHKFINDDKCFMNNYWLNKQQISSLMQIAQLTKILPKELRNELNPSAEQAITILANWYSATQANLTKCIKIIPILSSPIESRYFKIILQALLKKKQLRMTYWNRSSNCQSKRTVSPQQLILYKDQWYLDAYCHSREDLRTFSLIAIQTLHSINAPSKKITKKQIDDHCNKSYGIFAGVNKQKAIVEFRPKISRWIQFQQWHPNQRMTKLKNGGLRIEIPYHNPTELIADLLARGEEAIIVSPVALRRQMQEKIKLMQKNYK